MQNVFSKNILRFFFLTPLLSFFIIEVNAREDDNSNGSIKGIITTYEGKAAAYVLVQIKQLRKAAYTGEKGSFEINNVKPGTYNVEISFTGYENIVKQVTVEQGKTAELNIQLQLSHQQLEAITIITKRKFGVEGSDYIAKMPLSNLENPQVYSIISKELIASQMLSSVDDAMRNVAGVQQMWQPTGRAGDGGSWYNSRGFTMQNSLRNGLAGYVTNATDVANIETIESLKGPSGTLFGSVLTSYGGLINRVTKKPYGHFGGEVSSMAGGYNFSRVALDMNTPLNNAKNILFRLNTAYNYQGSFQNEGFNKRIFIAPSLLIKPSDRLNISLDAELSYGKGIMQPFIFFYFPMKLLGVYRADQIKNIDYQNSYIGDGLDQTSRSGNYFVQANYKISNTFTSSTNISFSHSYSNGAGPYFYLIPDAYKTHNPADSGKSNYLVRNSQNTIDNSFKNIFEAQQNFNGKFNIGNMQNKLLLGLDYTRSYSNITFYDPAPFDTVPLNVPNYDYSRFNATNLKNYYDTLSNQPTPYYDKVIINNYSAYISDVLSIFNNLSVLGALRLDHFYNRNRVVDSSTYNQTTLSPKFGIVYQPVLNKISIFANYQNSFTNQGIYNTVDASNQIVSAKAKPEQANQWEAGVKTNLINEKLSGSVSVYNILVKNMLYPSPNNRNAQIQNGEQRSRGVELELVSSPLNGLNIVGGFSYNDSKMVHADTTVNGLRPQTAASPWQAHWWLNYKLPINAAKSLRIGFGGNYASDNKIINDRTKGVFVLPSYIVLNTVVTYDIKNITIGAKVDNITNKHYWTGWTTMNPQMLRQCVASITYKF